MIRLVERARDRRPRPHTTTSAGLTDLYVREGAGAERLVERTIYGELLPDAADRNLRARPFRVYDAAGAATTEALDFAGNVLRASRRLPSDPAAVADWSALQGASRRSPRSRPQRIRSSKPRR